MESAQALSQFGLDFSLIERLFPGRSRRQIKRKYLKEEGKNKARLEASLRREPNRDLEQYRQMIAVLRGNQIDENWSGDERKEDVTTAVAEAGTDLAIRSRRLIPEDDVGDCNNQDKLREHQENSNDIRGKGRGMTTGKRKRKSNSTSGEGMRSNTMRVTRSRKKTSS